MLVKPVWPATVIRVWNRYAFQLRSCCLLDSRAEEVAARTREQENQFHVSHSLRNTDSRIGVHTLHAACCGEKADSEYACKEGSLCVLLISYNMHRNVYFIHHSFLFICIFSYVTISL
jgi:hypothetical protein